MRRKLERKVSFEFVDTPLTEAIAFCQILTKVSMVIGPDAAEAKGTMPITLKVTNESLGAALRRILAVAGLDYAFAGRAIYVSTPEGVAAAMREEAQVRLVERGIEERAARDGWEPALRKILSRKVTTELVDTPFTEAVLFLQTLFETTITIDAAVPEEKRRASVTLKAPSRQFAVALRQICDAVGLDYSVVGRAIVITMPEPEWAREFRAKLERRKVSFEFKDTPLTEAVAFLQILTKVSVIVDPVAARKNGATPVTLNVTNERLDVALRRVLVPAGLDWTLVGHAVFISTPARVEAERRAEAARRGAAVPEREREVRAMLRDRRVSFVFIDTPLGECVDFLGPLGKVDMVVEREVDQDRGADPITFAAADMPFDEALGWTCRLAGLDWTLTDRGVLVSTPERVAELRRRAAAARGEAEEPKWAREIRRKLERKVSFDFRDTPLREAFTFLQTLTAVTVIVDPEGAQGEAERPITLKVTNEPLGVALRRILALAGLDYALVGRAVLVSTRGRLAKARRAEAERRKDVGPAWAREFRAKLESRKTTFEFVETPFTEAIAFIQTLAKANMIVEPEAAEARGRTPVTLKVANMPLDEALGWTCRMAGLDWTFNDHALVISTPERIAELRRRPAARREAEPHEEPEWAREIRRKLERKVTFEFQGTPINEAIEFLQALTKISMIVDPAISEEKVRTTSTLKVTSEPLGVAFRRILAFAGLDHAITGNAVYISTPERLALRLRVAAERGANAGPEWPPEIRAKLQGKISFEFADTPLEEALQFLQTLTKVSMIVEPEAAEAKGRTPVTLKATAMPVGEALGWACRLAGLDWTFTDQALVISTPERIAELRGRQAAPREAEPPEEPEWAREIRRKLERKVTFEFVDTPVTEAVAFLQTLTKVSMVVDPWAFKPRGEPAVTTGATSGRASDVLRRVLRAANLDYALVDHVVLVSNPARLAFFRREETRAADVAVGPVLRAKLARDISFEFVDTPLSETLDFLRTLTKINFVVEPGFEELYGTRPVTLRVTSMPLASALRWVCRMADSGYVPAGDAVFVVSLERLGDARAFEAALARGDFSLPDGVWEVDLRRKLGRQISFEFVDTPLSEALQFLQTITEATIVTDPVALRRKRRTPVTLKVTNMQRTHALRWVLRLLDLEYGLVDGAVFVSTPERIASTRRAIHAKRFAEALRPGAEWRRAIRRKLDRRTSLTFVGTRFAEAVQFVRTLTGLNVILDPRAEATGRPIMLRAKSVQLDHALGWITRLAGCDWVLVDGAVFISTPERAATELLRSAERKSTEAARLDTIPDWERELRERLARKVSFEFAGTPFGDAAQFLCSIVKARSHLPAEARARPVTLKVTDMPLADALRWTCRLAGLDYVLSEGAIQVGAPGGPEWRRAMGPRLARKVTLSLAGPPAHENLGFLQALADVDFVIDPAAHKRWEKKLWLEFADVPLEDALARVLSNCRLAQAVIDEAVFVSTPERIAEVARIEAARLEREAARGGVLEWWEPGPRRALDGRVDLDLRDRALGQALGILSRASGLAISIGPAAGDDLAARPVSLDVLHGMRAGAALRWLCRLAGADYRLSEKGALVSTPGALRQSEIEAAIAKPITFKLNVHYADVIERVGGMAVVPVGLDVDLREDYNAVTFQVTDVTASVVLDRLAELGGLEWAVRDGGILVSTPAVISGKAEPEPEAAPLRPEDPTVPTDAPLTDEDDVF
ncbi:MAG: STN domain-containing protein [Planctomycetota bacterium]